MLPIETVKIRRLFRNMLRDLGTALERSSEDYATLLNIQHVVEVVGGILNVEVPASLLTPPERVSDRTLSLKTATFNEMVADAVAWHYLQLRMSEDLENDKALSFKHSKTSTKTELDRWLMRRFNLEHYEARSVSNSAGEERACDAGSDGIRWLKRTPAPRFSDYPDLEQMRNDWLAKLEAAGKGDNPGKAPVDKPKPKDTTPEQSELITTYVLTLRPLMSAALPPGFITTGNRTGYPFGTVTYPDSLPRKTAKDLGLLQVISSEDLRAYIEFYLEEKVPSEYLQTYVDEADTLPTLLQNVRDYLRDHWALLTDDITLSMVYKIARDMVSGKSAKTLPVKSPPLPLAQLKMAPGVRLVVVTPFHIRPRVNDPGAYVYVPHKFVKQDRDTRIAPGIEATYLGWDPLSTRFQLQIDGIDSMVRLPGSVRVFRLSEE